MKMMAVEAEEEEGTRMVEKSLLSFPSHGYYECQIVFEVKPRYHS